MASTAPPSFDMQHLWPVEDRIEWARRHPIPRTPPSVLPFDAWLATVTPDWDWSAPHLVMIRDHLDAVTQGDSDRLMIFLPPRHGKSEMTTVRYAAWRLECDPALPVIIAAYNQPFAERFSRKIRRIARPRITLSSERAAVGEWETTAGGGIRAVGVGAGVTGTGGSLIIIDDPIKNRAEADSPAYRERVWEWYTDDLFTRREPGAAVILIMTRWHEDDLAGRILASRDADRWDVLHLPALALDDDPLGREPGAALWPARFPVPALEQIRDVGDEGERGWWALYQGMPKPVGGALYQSVWWDGHNRYDFDDEYLFSQVVERYQFWDTAEEVGAGHAYTACITFDLIPFGRGYAALLRDVWRERVGFGDLLTVIEQRAEYWNARLLPNPRLQDVVIEKASSGKGAIAMLRLQAAPWLRTKIKPFPPVGSKDARAMQAAIPCRQGRVWLPYPSEHTPWLPAFERELLAVPNSQYRDQTDAFSSGVIYLRHYLRAPDALKESA